MKKIGIWLICLWMFLGFAKSESVLAEEIVLIPLTRDYTVARDALSQNGSEMLFQVLKDGQPLSEQDMMKMDFQFLWQEAGAFQSVIVEYGKNGMIAAIPTFEIADGIFGKALEWLTAFLVSSGKQEMRISYRESSGLIKTENYYFTIQKEALKISVIYGMIPFLFLIFIYGYLCKRRFKADTTLEFTYQSKREPGTITPCGPVVEERLSLSRWHPSGWFCLVPYIGNRKKVGDLVFRAGGMTLAKNRHLIIKFPPGLEEVRMMTRKKGNSLSGVPNRTWKQIKISRRKVRVPYGSRLSVQFREYPDLVFYIGIR